MDVSGLSVQQLLKLHAEIEGQLRKLEIINSANNPVGDLAETLFCRAFEWKPADKSQAYFDAEGPDGKRYQIKGRRIIDNGNRSRQLSAIRDLEGQHFDFLAGVLFNEDYSVKKAALIPYAVLLNLFKERKHISYQEHTRSYRFMLVDEILNAHDAGVTTRLKKVWH
jgi:hypothetical protein